MSIETAAVAQPISGDKLYQERARRALPLLVRQALAHQPIYYGHLAKELEMPNARNLNYVLGSIGQALLKLEKMWGEKIPPIQCLVLNQSSRLPGEGIGWFISKADFRKMTKRDQRTLVEAKLAEIFSYQKWPTVLDALNLPQPQFVSQELLKKARRLGGGESELHRTFKEFVAANPSCVGISKSIDQTSTEFDLFSGDKIDVMFQSRDEWTAVEVKSRISDEPDLLRGLFQCVKYQAVLEAMLS